MTTSELCAVTRPDPTQVISAAFTCAFPVRDLACTRTLFTQRPDNPRNLPLSTLHHHRKLLDHRAGQVTMPNNDTL